MEKHILVVGGMRIIHKYLMEQDVKITLIHEVGKIKGKDANKYNRIIGVENKSDINEWIKLAKAVHQLDPFTGIGGYAERYQEQASFIAEELNLKYYSPEVISNISNKYNMRKKLKDNQIEDVRFKTVKSLEEIEMFLDEVGGPIVLKPIDSWGSTGVSLIKEKSQIKEALSWIDDVGQINNMLVEEYISGEEFSVEVFSDNGVHNLISITKKYKDCQHFVEQGHAVFYEEQLGDKSLKIANRVFTYLDTLGLTHGPSHTEIIIDEESNIKIIETHARVGGDYIPELIKWSGGVDLLRLSAYQTLNKELNIVEENNNENIEFHAIWYVLPTKNGIIKKVIGLDDIKSSDEVVKVETLKNVGDKVDLLRNSFDRLAYVVAKGKSPQEAIENAIEHAEKIKIEVK